MSTALPARRQALAGRLPHVVRSEPEIALLVSTYEKPWHLERVLTSIALQEGVEGRMELVVTDDGSCDETAHVVDRFARTAPFPVAFTTHAHQTFQLSRCRNEGVRASRAPYLLFLDGDSVLPPDHVRAHLARRRQGYTVGAYRCSFDEATTARIDDQAIASRAYLDWSPRCELRRVARCDRKARFYQWIGHPTKPKLLGNNMGIWRGDYERVNGFDEHYQGWGCEDDDLRIRLRRVGVRTASISRWTRTYHLWHPPTATAPGAWREGANVAYFSRPGRLTRCMNGLVKRSVEDLAVRVVGRPSRPEAADAILKSRFAEVAKGESPEVELCLLPGDGRFSGRADCNVLVVLDDSPRAARLARKAHLLITDRPVPGFPPERCFPLDELDRALASLG
jgi:glycosyltransferase involved in cell wall biosynthesis